MIRELLIDKYNDFDFPFYRHNPRIPEEGWIILFSTIIIGIIAYKFIYEYSEIIASIIECLIMLLPLLYYCQWDERLIFHKPTRNEITLAFLMFATYIIYAIIMTIIFETTGGGGEAVEKTITLETMISLIFSMMSEELLKFIPLMFFMRIFYKFSFNRDASFILSAIIVLIFFGFLHYNEGLTITSVLLMQGLGSVVEMFGYAKTKNLFVPYISHLLTDVFILGLSFLP